MRKGTEMAPHLWWHLSALMAYEIASYESEYVGKERQCVWLVPVEHQRQKRGAHPHSRLYRGSRPGLQGRPSQFDPSQLELFTNDVRSFQRKPNDRCDCRADGQEESCPFFVAFR